MKIPCPSDVLLEGPSLGIPFLIVYSILQGGFVGFQDISTWRWRPVAVTYPSNDGDQEAQSGHTSQGEKQSIDILYRLGQNSERGFHKSSELKANQGHDINMNKVAQFNNVFFLLTRGGFILL